MPLKGVLQSRWLKGLNAAFGLFSQPPNSLPRLSNFVLTRLGSLQTTPGSRIVSSYEGLSPNIWLPVDSGMWKEIAYYNPSDHPERSGYFALRAEPAIPRLQGSVGTPTATVVPVANAFGFGTNQFRVTAADGVGGESLPSPTVTVNPVSGQGISLTFARVPHAYGYNVYVFIAGRWLRLVPYPARHTFSTITLVNQAGTATPITYTLANFPQSQVGITPAPSNPFQISNTSPPASDTTQTCNLLFIPVDGTGWNYNVTTNLIYVFPADTLTNPIGDSGHPGTAGSGQRGDGAPRIGGGGGPGSISGGIAGIISPIPQIIQFADKMFLALGNGITPYWSVGFDYGNTQPISNTFQATIPAWQPSIGYIVGDQVVPSGSSPSPPGANTKTLFTATQGGISGATEPGKVPTGGTIAIPPWPTTLDATIADGQVVWKNSGSVATSSPPLGAAHCEVYAGSLWVANTRPSFNQQYPSDGPSALWMSDANNPDSWNPLNTAQVARDDGTEIMGLKAFSIAEAGIPTTQQLVVFKNFTTYVVNGVFGAADFSIQQAETDQGCVAPRTIQFVPGFGLMRLTHLGFSYFDGIRDTLVSTDLHPYLFGDPNQPDIQPMDWAFSYFAKAAQVADPPMYICAVPVLGANADLLGVIPASQFTITTGVASGAAGQGIPFPAGQYYFRISVRGPILETAVTPEIGPIPGPPLGAFFVTSNAPLGAGYTGWRIYWGSNGPGSESHYQDTGPELYSTTPGTPGTTLIYPGALTTGPPIGLSGTLTRIFCYDLTLKCWTILDLPFSISVLKWFRRIGEPPTVLAGGFWDNTIRQLFSGATDWDGIPIDWGLQSAEVYNQGGDSRVFYRRLRIRGTGNGPISITPNRDGFDDEKLPAVFWALGGNQFMAEGAIMAEGVNCHAKIEGKGQVVIDSLNFHAVPKPTGAGVVIS